MLYLLSTSNKASIFVPLSYTHYCIFAILLVCTECLNIHGTYVTANNSTNNNVVFFFVSDLKIVYYNNY